MSSLWANLSKSGRFLDARWTAFWFRPEPTHTLALVRIFFGVALLLEITNANGLYRVTHLEAALPRLFGSKAEYPLAGFRIPWPGLEWLPAPSWEVFRVLETALLPLTLLFIAGFLTRWVGPLLALLYLYVFLLSQLLYHHHVLLLVIGLLILGFSRCADHYSLDAYLAGPHVRRPQRRALPRRMLQALVVTVYLFATLQKLEPAWVTGWFLEVLHAGGRTHGPLAALVFAQFPTSALSLLAIGTEGFLAVALCFPPLQLAAIWVGTFFHLGIDAILAVGSYSYAMLALYVAFVSPRKGRIVALYDGGCGFCGRSVRAARLLDWFGRVRWLNFRELDQGRTAVLAAERANGSSGGTDSASRRGSLWDVLSDHLPAEVAKLSRPRLDEEMAAVEPDGKVHWGFDAWRVVLRRLPLTFLIAPLLYVPPVPAVGRAVYAWVARNRGRLGGSAVCSLPEPRVAGVQSPVGNRLFHAEGGGLSC